MKFNAKSFFREYYYKTVNSIAFYPAIIVLFFLFLSALSIAFDFSDEGKQIKSELTWLRLKDPATARSIIAAIAAGIISLTVFSFSMVMIVLNQTASQLSNRILDRLIGSRFQQIVLGIYVGTTVYALFLLSTIRDIDSGIHIPAISTYLLIGLTVFDIFLFIYFLHYITQSVKYDVIIRRIYEETLHSMEILCDEGNERVKDIHVSENTILVTEKAGIYEGFDKNALLQVCDREDCVVSILHPPGSFLVKGVPLAKVNIMLPNKVKEEIQKEIFYIHDTESIKGNFFYGFKQLTEVAIKALSPGINDPGTAVQVIRSLFELYSQPACSLTNGQVVNSKNVVRIVKKQLTFEEIIKATLLPIWDYGKKDRIVRDEFQHLLRQITLVTPAAWFHELLEDVTLEINSHKD